ncbi:ComEC/Rec2 family competence protein [Streptomyces sp. NPDC091209]|uniref:ComEC/Rec2 family competence protein n=1 Tax=Streptomyces sp. NPDC091209 TaxID=3365974 RepID=UPI003826D12C
MMPGTRSRKRGAPPSVTVARDRVEAKKLKEEVDTAELEEASEDAETLVAEAEPIVTDAVVDGDLSVHCLDALQGDCTLITTPAGHHVMIDCGLFATTLNDPGNLVKRARVKALADAVRGFLGADKRLDILILTHSDKDHHNEIVRCLQTGMEVGSVYISGTDGDYQRQARNRLAGIMEPSSDDPTQSGLPKQVACRWTTTDRTATEVVLRTLDGETTYGAVNGTIDVRDTANCLIKILVEPNCTVSILAAGVLRDTYPKVQDTDDLKIDDGDALGSNCGSIVTLIEAYGKRLLFCGDATVSTEQFLVDKHQARIADLDLLRIAHHGSGETSSTKSLIETAKAKTAVISSGRQYSTFHHPRWAAVRRYLNEFSSRVPSTPPDARGTLPLQFWHGFSAEENNEVNEPPEESENQQPLGINSLVEAPAGRGTLYNATLGYPLRQTPYTHTVTKPTDGLRDAAVATADAIEEGVR